MADENDSPPVFERSRYVAVVNEDALPRTAIMRLSTSDADATTEPVHFYITSGDPQAQFEVGVRWGGGSWGREGFVRSSCF